MAILTDPITVLPKIGPAVARNFERVNIKTIRDLLWYFPRRYIDFRTTVPIAEVKSGQTVTIHGTIKTIAAPHFYGRAIPRAEAVISDSSGSVKLVWFNQPYMAKNIQPGDEVAIAGTARYYKKSLQLQNPVYEKMSAEAIHTGRLVPVYPSGVSNRMVRNAVAAALPAALQEVDTLPEELLKKYKLPAITKVLSTLHFPESEELLNRAQNRIAFDELLLNQLGLALRSTTEKPKQAPKIKLQTAFIAKLLTTLPFTLTDSQKRALWDSMQDLTEQKPMVRLLQGDVGSGKTIVAGLLATSTAAGGYQTAFVAPTEILAHQHYEYIKKYLPDCNVGLLSRSFVALSTANNETVSKKELLSAIETGVVDILIGTHAILQKGITFDKLGLVIIDEQHRFGVEQRSFLLDQLKGGKKVPHLLSMSATPIPRTLALAFYGDLKLSALTTVPFERSKITTTVATDNDREALYARIRNDLLTTNAQAFIVTPRVEDDESSALKSVKAEYERLQKEEFPGISMGLLYGSMKGVDKETAMSAFNSGKNKILVTTSVIETGIDVAAASIMIIEGAERFGLAQLHQLRGRIGRAGQESWCVLFPTSDDSSSLDRLQFFASCRDGFKLAERDLQQRGFGNLFGTEQSGFSFHFPEFFTLEMVAAAEKASKELLADSPNLHKYPELQRKTEQLIQTMHAE